MNQNTVSTSTGIDFSGFGGFTALASLLSKESEQSAVVALDTPKVYGARTATKPVETKAPSGPMPDLPKPVIGTKARNPNFGVEDVVRIRRSVARREIEKGVAEREAKLFAVCKDPGFTLEKLVEAMKAG